MKHFSLSEARANLSTLVVEISKGKGPVAISQRSKLKAVLVDANWYFKTEEELSSYRQSFRSKPFRLGGTMELSGDVDRALEELRQELDGFLEKSIEGLK
ncbi:MAG: type II toxin-antitoxin system Phd/YefM family antitoxin [Deltaproteobacteria bacterium]|nr:type II toxin-antitoxin system Phd/YefM family antitoxin [Deltaproteobacteria bacterium]